MTDYSSEGNLSERSSMDDMDLISDEEHDHIKYRKRSSSHLGRGEEQNAKVLKASRLVSYDDDDDDVANTTHEVEDKAIINDSNEEEDSSTSEIVSKKLKETEKQDATLKNSVINYPYMGHDVELPSEPAGKCPKRIQDRVSELYNKMMRDGTNMNQSIRATKKFRNPVIYEKLLEFLDIDEKGTNYPTELYNPAIWGPHSHYEELAKIQNTEMEKRDKDKKEGKKDKPTIDKIQGTKKTKTKWDDPAANSNGQQKAS